MVSLVNRPVASAKQRTEPLRPALLSILCVLATCVVIGISIHSVMARPIGQDRKARLDSLSEAEQDRLRRNYDRFSALDQAEQMRLIKLDQALSLDPSEVQLREIVPRYHELLKSLPAGQATRLQKLPLAERVVQIREAANAREQQQVDHADRIVLMAWIENRIIQYLAEPAEREHLTELPPIERRGRVMQMFWQRQRGAAELVLPITEQDIDDLKQKASPRFRQRLDKDPEHIRQIVFQRLRDLPRSFSDRGVGMFSLEEQKQNEVALKDFFEHGLNDEQRDDLLSLPPTQMHDELRREYLTSKFPAMSTFSGLLHDGQRLPPTRHRFDSRRGRDRSGPRMKDGERRHRPGDGKKPDRKSRQVT